MVHISHVHTVFQLEFGRLSVCYRCRSCVHMCTAFDFFFFLLSIAFKSVSKMHMASFHLTVSVRLQKCGSFICVRLREWERTRGSRFDAVVVCLPSFDFFFLSLIENWCNRLFVSPIITWAIFNLFCWFCCCFIFASSLSFARHSKYRALCQCVLDLKLHVTISLADITWYSVSFSFRFTGFCCCCLLYDFNCIEQRNNKSHILYASYASDDGYYEVIFFLRTFLFDFIKYVRI